MEVRDPPPRHRLVAEAYDVAGPFPVPEAVVAALGDAEDIPSVAAWGRGVPGSLLLSSAAAAIKWCPKAPPPRGSPDRPTDRRSVSNVDRKVVGRKSQRESRNIIM